MNQRNPNMCLLDQILLDKLESDLKTEAAAARELVKLEQMIAGGSVEFTICATLFNGRISSIQEQIKEIKDRYE